MGFLGGAAVAGPKVAASAVEATSLHGAGNWVPVGEAKWRRAGTFKGVAAAGADVSKDIHILRWCLGPGLEGERREMLRRRRMDVERARVDSLRSLSSGAREAMLARYAVELEIDQRRTGWQTRLDELLGGEE